MEAQRESAHKRGYGRRWQRYRLTFLRANPLCVECLKYGRVKAATVVDHTEAHKGDYELFWEPGNHQALCADCHLTKTLSEMGKERHDFSGCDSKGFPTDPRHPWGRGEQNL